MKFRFYRFPKEERRLGVFHDLRPHFSYVAFDLWWFTLSVNVDWSGNE